MYKMIPEIISMPRADPSYPHNFGVDSLVFQDDELKTEAKTRDVRLGKIGGSGGGFPKSSGGGGVNGAPPS